MSDLAVADEDIRIVIEDDDGSVSTDQQGNIAIEQPDGGVVVQLNPHKKAAQAGEEDPAKFYENLVDRIDEGTLAVIAAELHEAVSADDSSRSEWMANRAAGMALLGLKMDDPKSGDGVTAVDGQSVVTNPLLLEAVLKGWANASAELLPAEGPCKIANYDDQPEATDDELGEALQRDMNYYLTTIATEFVPQTSHMLLWGCYFGGSGFKKVYTHPLKKRPYSESVPPERLIVSDASKSFEECERITHEIPMRQSVMKRYQQKGIYRKISLAPPTPVANQVDEEVAATQGVAINKDRPEDMPYTLWETQCELDLDEFAPPAFKGSGVPLPYLVTMDKDSMQILAIRRDWKPEDEDCTRKEMYVQYLYVPGPGFYGTGLLNILGNSSAAMTAAWRISLDAGMFANFPGFLLDKLAGRQNTSDFRLAPGTAALIETGGRDIKQVIAELPYKDVTAGLMTMMDKITEQSKATAGAPDIPVGEGMSNIPVGTMIAHVEQATKVMSAAHKGQHTAMDKELTLIADLFRENPEAFWKGNKKSKAFWSVERLLQALAERTLVPKSDPNVPSHIHRVMKAMALFELAKSPLGKLMDMKEVLRRVLLAMREDPNGLVLEQQPEGESPDLIKAKADLLKAQAAMEKNQVDLKEAELQPQIEQIKQETAIKGKTIDLAKTLITHDADQEQFAHQREMDMAELARGANQDAISATKVTHDAMKLRTDTEAAQRKDGLAMAQMQQKSQGEKRDRDNADIGLLHQMRVDTRDRDLAERKITHQMAADNDKVGLERMKLGIAQQDSDTKRQAVLNPPKPAGGAKPKKKK